ncbi:MAG: hypothetical protein ABIF88_03760 [archaeon]
MELETEITGNRKVKSKKRYFLAFIIGTSIFLIGFAITSSISYLEYQRISNLQDPTSYQIFSDKLAFTLFNEDICSEENYLEISNDLGFQGRIIGALEEKMGKNDARVLFRKKFYSLIQLEHFEYVKLINEECDKNINTILFFYSNEDEVLGKSEGFGDILSVLHEKTGNDLVIYSFDMNLDSEIVRLLNKKYKIDNQITIIVNEEHTLTTIDNINEIESLLH